MILFLDTVSSLPEFSLIEDNKLLYTQKIIGNDQEKMSECIFPTYIDLINKYPVEKKLEYLIVNTGPGSYTALRIGIAFLSGLSIAKKISLRGISCLDLFLLELTEKQFNETAIFINSSNNQKFICIYDLENIKYKIYKFDNNFNFLNLKKDFLKKIITNENISNNDLKLLYNLKFEKVSFQEVVIKNLKLIIKKKNQDIIEPMYISNNPILN